MPGAWIAIMALKFGLGFGPAIGFLAAARSPWLFFAEGRLTRTRRLLEAGYSRSDIVLAIRQQAERRYEELAFEIGNPPTRLGRWIRRVAWGSLGLAAAGAVWLVLFARTPSCSTGSGPARPPPRWSRPSSASSCRAEPSRPAADRGGGSASGPAPSARSWSVWPAGGLAVGWRRNRPSTAPPRSR